MRSVVGSRVDEFETRPRDSSSSSWAGLVGIDFDDSIGDETGGILALGPAWVRRGTRELLVRLSSKSAVFLV